MNRPKPSDGAGIVRVSVRIIGVPAGVLALLGAFLVVTSQLSTNPAADPHGYGLIFGAMIAFCAGLVYVVAVPFMVPKRLRRRGFAVAAATFVLGALLLFVTGQLSSRDDGTPAHREVSGPEAVR